MKRIAVLVSGGGTNLQALIDAQGSVLNSGKITLVVANNAGAYALERAKKAGIDTAVVLKKECGSQEAFETRLMEVLDESGIDIIILAGFMTILTERFTGHYPKRILNVHPSLIPSFCGEGFYGLKVHEEALKYGVKVTGATIHFVNETPDGKKAVAAYFIMGRSVNSRNRVFIQEADGIRTEAHDPALMKDPHLIIYHPVREIGNGLIVTNGDQTDTIWEYLARGESWEAALRTRMFEDDGPNWTPRISGIQANDGSYKMSILKAADPEGNACARFFYEYPATAGLGHFIHTYVCDGNPVIPTFQGEPERVEIPADIDAFTKELWENLNENNKISLFVRYTDLATREVEQRIINKHC